MNCDNIPFLNNEKSQKLFKLKNPVGNVIREILASCHSLTKVQNQIIGKNINKKLNIMVN